MKAEMTVVRMKILFTVFHNQQKKINAAAIAQALHISKSTVSRAVEYFQRHKLLKEEGLELTFLGEQLISKYWEQKERLQMWLVTDAEMERIEAEEEAVTMLLHTREKSMDALIALMDTKKRNSMLCEMEGFCEKCIDYLLDDGQYDISFTFYKDNHKKHMQVSMANDGFYHPGILQVTNGIGVIRLESKKVVRNIPLGSGMIAGRVDNLSYLQNHQYIDAVHEGKVWKFPVSCLKFTYNKGEHILMGSAILKLSCSIGKMYMPESTTIFLMTLAL